MMTNLINTAFSFYSHNWEFVYFGGFGLLCFLRLVLKPSRYYALLLLGFIVLLFEFEYSKHLIGHVRENVTDLILVNPAKRSFGLADSFFSKLLPILMQAFGWLCVAVSVFFLPKEEVRKDNS